MAERFPRDIHTDSDDDKILDDEKRTTTGTDMKPPRIITQSKITAKGIAVGSSGKTITVNHLCSYISPSHAYTLCTILYTHVFTEHIKNICYFHIYLRWLKLKAWWKMWKRDALNIVTVICLDDLLQSATASKIISRYRHKLRLLTTKYHTCMYHQKYHKYNSTYKHTNTTYVVLQFVLAHGEASLLVLVYGKKLAMIEKLNERTNVGLTINNFAIKKDILTVNDRTTIKVTKVCTIHRHTSHKQQHIVSLCNWSISSYIIIHLHQFFADRPWCWQEDRLWAEIVRQCCSHCRLVHNPTETDDKCSWSCRESMWDLQSTYNIISEHSIQNTSHFAMSDCITIWTRTRFIQ